MAKVTGHLERHERSSAGARQAPGQARWHMVVCVATLAALVRLVPDLLSFGTSDVMAWELLGQLFLKGENFYATQLHNWPPLWIYFTAGAWFAHEATGLPFAFLVKLPPTAADVWIAALLSRRAAGAGFAYALHPIAILITGYHGQFDALMLAPMVLAWQLWDSSVPRRHVASGLALGLAVWFKPVPLLLLPILLPRLAMWRARILYTCLAVLPAVVATLPYLVLWPEDVIANSVAYSSWFGQWGYPVAWMLLQYVRHGTIPAWLPDPANVSPSLQLMFAAGRWVLLAALVGTWWYTYKRRCGVLHSILATFAVFYVATSGFGLQYLLWIVPFALAARDRWLWPYTITATGFLLAGYTFGQAYLGPFSAGPEELDAREFLVKLAGLPTWLVCVAWAGSLLRRCTLGNR
jgi:hypothetical protein